MTPDEEDGDWIPKLSFWDILPVAVIFLVILFGAMLVTLMYRRM